MPDKPERRKFPRLNLNVGVEYKVLKEPESLLLATQSKNISAGGICIILLDKVDTASILDLNFSLPDSKEVIRTKGRVAWSEEFIVGDPITGRAYDAGIQFIDVKPQDREKINQYVRMHL